jgi:hypothetical protein
VTDSFITSSLLCPRCPRFVPASVPASLPPRKPSNGAGLRPISGACPRCPRQLCARRPKRLQMPRSTRAAATHLADAPCSSLVPAFSLASTPTPPQREEVATPPPTRPAHHKPCRACRLARFHAARTQAAATADQHGRKGRGLHLHPSQKDEARRKAGLWVGEGGAAAQPLRSRKGITSAPLRSLSR